MIISSQVKQLLEDALRSVERDPQQHLHPNRRLAVYQAFGPTLNLTGFVFGHGDETFFKSPGYRGYAYLAIETARYVLPIWDQVSEYWKENAPHDESIAEYKDYAHRLLKVSDDLLNNRITGQNAYHWLCTEYSYHEGLSIEGGVGTMAYDVREDMYYALESTATCIAMLLGKQPFRCDLSDSHLNDETLGSNQGDVAHYAVKAFTVTNPYSPAIAWQPTPAHFDNHKRLEFWQWWLGQAVPAAWEANR